MTPPCLPVSHSPIPSGEQADMNKHMNIAHSQRYMHPCKLATGQPTCPTIQSHLRKLIGCGSQQTSSACGRSRAESTMRALMATYTYMYALAWG